MEEQIPSQGFLIRTPNFAVTGMLVKENGVWSVSQIDPRLKSMEGLTAQELKNKCEGFGWKVARWSS